MFVGAVAAVVVPVKNSVKILVLPAGRGGVKKSCVGFGRPEFEGRWLKNSAKGLKSGVGALDGWGNPVQRPALEAGLDGRLD